MKIKTVILARTTNRSARKEPAKSMRIPFTGNEADENPAFKAD
ncbi:hypothetical protein [Domibacillus indicus]|nr:hypothetical protein [Domibacillus indicus]